MKLRTLVFCVGSLALGVALFPATSAITGVASAGQHSVSDSNDTRPADRDAIRAHLDKIFRAYVNKDLATIRATHASGWTGFTLGSRSIIHGLDDYMRDAEGATKSPLLIADYKLSDIDYVFYGDVALVPYVADVVAGSTLRLAGKFRSLDVYAKIDGNWIQVGSNIDLHPDTLEDQRRLPGKLSAAQREELLATRESFWRAFLTNDRAQMERAFPSETIAINAGSEQWDHRESVFSGAAQLAQAGAKLTKLEFPKTEVQVYGDVAILYSTYDYALDIQGKPISQSGRATEVFVRRKGSWVNPGWHLDSGK